MKKLVPRLVVAFACAFPLVLASGMGSAGAQVTVTLFGGDPPPAHDWCTATYRVLGCLGDSDICVGAGDDSSVTAKTCVFLGTD